MEAAEKVSLPVFKLAPWSDAIGAFLLPALDHDANALTLIRDRCAAGLFQLLGVFDGDDLIAACVIRVDGDEGVIVAAGGHWQGGGLVEMLLPVLELGFKNAGLSSVRVETFRRGLMEKISRTGYRPAFVAFRKVL